MERPLLSVAAESPAHPWDLDVNAVLFATAAMAAGAMLTKLEVAGFVFALVLLLVLGFVWKPPVQCTLELFRDRLLVWGHRELEIGLAALEAIEIEPRRAGSALLTIRIVERDALQLVLPIAQAYAIAFSASQLAGLPEPGSLRVRHSVEWDAARWRLWYPGADRRHLGVEVSRDALIVERGSRREVLRWDEIEAIREGPTGALVVVRVAAMAAASRVVEIGYVPRSMRQGIAKVAEQHLRSLDARRGGEREAEARARVAQLGPISPRRR